MFPMYTKNIYQKYTICVKKLIMYLKNINQAFEMLNAYGKNVSHVYKKYTMCMKKIGHIF